MKKLILLALTAVVMVGCTEKYKTKNEIEEYYNDISNVVVIDSCEYLYIKNTGIGLRSHKGNCKFCKERRKKELEELVKMLKD